MILNMHIRNDYTNWGVEGKPKKRVTTLCGKMSLPKYCGVPGITRQVPVADRDSGDYGWCLTCAETYLLEVAALQDKIIAINNPYLTNLFLDGVRAMTAQVHTAKAGYVSQLT